MLSLAYNVPRLAAGGVFETASCQTAKLLIFCCLLSLPTKTPIAANRCYGQCFFIF